MRSIPASALWLGWAGVIPFAALTALTLVDRAGLVGMDESAALRSLVAYGAIILSFMGGVQWGLEMTRPESAMGPGFAASVLPALAAFAATFATPLTALLILAAAFAALLGYDQARLRAGIGPAWYGRLRWQLTSAVILCLVLAAARSI